MSNADFSKTSSHHSPCPSTPPEISGKKKTSPSFFPIFSNPPPKKKASKNQNITPQKKTSDTSPKKITILWLYPKKNLNKHKHNHQPTNKPTTRYEKKKRQRRNRRHDVVFSSSLTFFVAPVPRPNLGWDQPSSYPASSQPSVRSGGRCHNGGLVSTGALPLLPPGGFCFNQVGGFQPTHLEKYAQKRQLLGRCS